MTQKQKTILGFVAGVTAGVSYGLNSLFGKPLLDGGMTMFINPVMHLDEPSPCYKPLGIQSSKFQFVEQMTLFRPN